MAALSFDDPETDSLAHQLASLTGETLTQAVRNSLVQRLRRETLKRDEDSSLARELEEIAKHCAALPILDHRTAEEIIGYDENGLPS